MAMIPTAIIFIWCSGLLSLGVIAGAVYLLRVWYQTAWVQSVGTAIYMAPERASSTVVDAHTDLYSVGVVLYEMLTGQVPYHGISPVEVLRSMCASHCPGRAI